MHTEGLDTGGAASSGVATHEEGDWEVAGADHKLARAQSAAPHTADTYGFATDDEDMLEWLRAELAPATPEAHTHRNRNRSAPLNRRALARPPTLLQHLAHRKHTQCRRSQARPPTLPQTMLAGTFFGLAGQFRQVWKHFASASSSKLQVSRASRCQKSGWRL